MDSIAVPSVAPHGPQGSVSIVIPTFNHLDLLKSCIASIGTYTDLANCEVIVVANGCTDGTVDYLATLPPPYRHIVHAAPLGFTAAANAGIRAALGEYVVLLNNDTVLLPQAKHAWVNMLLAPFLAHAKVGITGPVKFAWDCGGVQREAVAFWCAMIPRALFSLLGPLDEVFSPGMGEDGDFSIKAAMAGYKLVQVPVDSAAPFGAGIPNQTYPIYHKGSGTFGDKDYSAITQRNSAILAARYGKRKDNLETIYQQCLAHTCDVNALFPTLRAYAAQCAHVTEFGVRGVMTTWALLAARPQRLVSYDIEYNGNIEGAKKEAQLAGVPFEFKLEDTLKATIEQTDMLFIDTVHTYAQLKAELARHAGQVSKYILIHDTATFGDKGADGGPGENAAIQEHIAAHPEWGVHEVLTISNGLTVLCLCHASSATHTPLSQPNGCKVSIVIPTCGKDWASVLKPCIEAVLAYTDLADKEIIVVANGAPAVVEEYLRVQPIRMAAYPNRLGYIGAVNTGIAMAKGDYVITFDDDCTLMQQPKDYWVQALLAPLLADSAVAAAGPFSTHYKDGLGHVLHSGCTIYRRAALAAVGGFDAAFDPGYMGDEDLAIRLRGAGYKLAAVPPTGPREYANGLFVLEFPVVHMGTVNTMDKHGADLPLVKKNRDLLYQRHVAAVPAPRHQKISIIIPTYKDNWRVDEQTGVRVNLLRRNLETLGLYTDLAGRGVEVIVVCNGCVDGQAEYVAALGAPYRAIVFPDALGYTRATNEGIKVAKGDYLIFLNDDVELLPQVRNQWLDWLLVPFASDPKMGVTGPLQLHDDYAGEDAIIGFCLCTTRQAMAAVMQDTGGLLDEIYSPGAGEDIDLCCKMRRAGYGVLQVPRAGKLGFSHTNTGEFQIWHVNNQTFKDMPEYTRWIVKRNGHVNCKRYNKDIKLNLGSGGIFYKGYLSVDMHDNRADIIMDITQLDFADNSVAEIMASHVFEHLNPYKALDILKGWWRVLKPGGRLIMEMPDIEALCRRFVTAPIGERYGILNAVYGSVNTTDSGAPSDITSPHLFGWWPDSIRDHLHNAGFVGVTFGPEIWPHPESNMHVEAVKP